MHELSIALSILDAIDDRSRRAGGLDVRCVRVRIGPLSGVVRDALESAFEIARQGTAFGDCRIDIEETSVLVHCPLCREDRPAESAQRLCCAVCGAPASRVVSGRELDIVALEIEDHEHAAG